MLFPWTQFWRSNIKWANEVRHDEYQKLPHHGKDQGLMMDDVSEINIHPTSSAYLISVKKKVMIPLKMSFFDALQRISDGFFQLHLTAHFFLDLEISLIK